MHWLSNPNAMRLDVARENPDVQAEMSFYSEKAR